ncbi:MAG: EAL domain-containing protein [Phormidesmis sp.]
MSDHSDSQSLLQSATSRFRDTFDYAAVGICLIGLNGQWIQVNESACETLGYTQAELFALKFHDIFHADDLDTVRACAEHTLAEDVRGCQQEIRCFHRQGYIVWVLLNTSVARDENGQPLYFIVQLQDISQYKQMEADLRAHHLENIQQVENQALLKAITDVILVRDSEGRCLKVLPTQADNLYRPANEMLGKTLHETLPQEPADIIFGYIQKALEAQHPIQGEYTLPMRGQIVNFAATFSPIEHAKVLIITHDVTAQKQIENELRLQGLIAKNMGEGICLLRAADNTMVYTNPKFEQMFGYEPGEMIGQHVTILNYEDGEQTSADVAEELLDQINRQGSFSYEVHNIKKDGEPFWCKATTSVFDHPVYGQVYVAVQADISAEKRSQASVQLLQKLTLAINEAEDFEAVLRLILKEVGELYSWTYGEAWIPSPEGNVLMCSPAFYSCAGSLKNSVPSPIERFRKIAETFTFPLGVGIPGRVWSSRQPEWQVDVSEQQEATFLRKAAAAECGIKAGLAIPLVANDTVLAVLVFFKQKPAEVDPLLMGSLNAAAAQLNLMIQRRQAEDELFRAKEMAQITLHSIGDAVVTTDAQGQVQYLNPVAQILMGWNQFEIQGKPLRECFQLVNGTTREQVPNPIEQALTKESIVSFESNAVLINRNGKEIAISDSAAPIRSRDDRIVGAVMVFQDISEQRALSQKLSWQATHDTLTRLINRREFETQLEIALSEVKAQERSHVLCFLDLDQFKTVNDTCGHAAGDELLRQVTALWQSKIRKSDTLARLGGDEFGLILHQCPLEPALKIANILREQIQDLQFLWNGKRFQIGVSIGLVIIDETCKSGDIAMSKADAACYTAKRQGRNHVYLYNEDNDQALAQAQGQLQWIDRLTQALEKDQFCLYYQPIVPVANAGGDAEHYEVLLRLRDEQGNLVPPGAFIPAAERYGLMHRIDRWVVKNLFEIQGAHYRSVWNSLQENEKDNYLYTINLSGASLDDDQFAAFLREQFLLHQVPPQLICFEVTETVAIANLTKAAQFMTELKALGCRFALDDFGSGMSSFGYLKNLPVDYLKIDGSFVKHMAENPVDEAFVEAINRVGQVLGLKTVAEFVENDAILAKLKQIGVDYAQGYGIAEPRPLMPH